MLGLVKTVVRNNTSGPVALPPFRQVLLPGGALICNETPAQVRAAFAGTLPAGLEVGEVDASAKTGQLTITPVQATLALDGTVNPPNQVVLPAGHLPGMYLVARYINRRANPTAGSIVTAVLWSDQAPFSASLSQSLISSGSLLNPGLIPCFSDGSAALEVSIAFTGMTGTCNVDVRSWAVLQQ